MSRFNAPPPNGDSRKMTEQRIRDAAHPAAPEKKGGWPFIADKQLLAAHQEGKPSARSSKEKKSG